MSVHTMHTGVIFNLLINTLTHTHTHTHTHTQLVMGEEAVLTFSCTSVVEREEWTEAFRVLNQLAQPCGNPQQVTLPITGEEGERGEGRRWEGKRGEGRRWEERGGGGREREERGGGGRERAGK